MHRTSCVYKWVFQVLVKSEKPEMRHGGSEVWPDVSILKITKNDDFL